MGRCMSGVPSCALIAPSSNSTIECTTDCGWISTEIRSAGIPKSQRASITSNPLLTSVAESIVILAPMSPLRVSQGLFDSHFGEPLARYVAQCTARTGDDQPPRGRRFAHQALEDGRMFGVDRQDRGPSASAASRMT